MQNYPRRMVIFGFVTSAIVGVATILDMAIGWPFAGRIGFDLTFLLCSALLGYMSYDTWHDVIQRYDRPKQRRAQHQSSRRHTIKRQTHKTRLRSRKQQKAHLHEASI